MTSQCTHRSFRPIYKTINIDQAFRKRGEYSFECTSCGKTCVLSTSRTKTKNQDKKFTLKKILTGSLWMLPALTFVMLFVYGVISPIAAIGLTLAYHFIAMYVIICHSSYLKVTEVSEK